MNSKKLYSFFVIGIIFANSSYALTNSQSGEIKYITGGIGDEERNTLKEAKDKYNLSVVSAARTGEYVGDTRLIISDQQGRELLDTEAGPLFYAQLPPGKYVVEAESRGQARKRQIIIGENKPSHIHFSWK